MDIIVIYVTNKDMNNAQKVTDHLFDLRLIAVVNYFTITSQYVWQWQIKTNDEIVAIYKTKKENWSKVKQAIKSVHPYSVPCIMKLPVCVNTFYGEWVVGNVV